MVAGVRHMDKAREKLKEFKELKYVRFDFEQPDTFETALENIDTVFLLRPPHISDIEKYFRPLISVLKEKQIKEVVFLSVQGAERSKVIPHHRIEQLIKAHDLDFIFLRPSYFMQNLTTTLLQDIQEKRKIILPSGRGKFNWIDIENIAEVAAMMLSDFSTHKNQAIELTGYENKNFYQVAELFNQEINLPVRYVSVNPLRFFRIRKKEGMVRGMIVVMLLLHFLPRVQKEPSISRSYEQLTGKAPSSLRDFIRREKELFC
ncbi:MAG: NmrA family NAD(P)-binding protein [Bacteroidales bacterium]|nr:NmrA family NAD(P)-binding protein [Bacteroidales bacterium]